MGLEILQVASRKENERCVPAWTLDWKADFKPFTLFLFGHSYVTL